MAGEIATAFVRVRPNMAGFKSETEHGVRSAFEGIAKVVGVALGAGEAFSFGKEAVQGAASLQKQIETINEEFGAAAKSVTAFGDSAATQLGISASVADTTSARFGILFQNLGIGAKTAAGMTIGMEKLAGSISAIRGVDPASILDRLPLVLAGNVRALKQLGLSIDASQIKFAALKLGLISSVKDALTPATKAQAIYALATANLGKFQAQAAKHSGDLINVQRRLSAEWSNAKDALGKALLPEFARLTRALEQWLKRMTDTGRLQRDFNAIARTTVTAVKLVTSAISTGWQIWQTATGWIGGTKQAIIALFAILTVNKIRAIAGSIVTNLVDNGFKRVGAASEVAKKQALESMGTMGVAAKGLSLTIKEALISSAIGALVVAIGIATSYVVTHWDTIKRYTLALAHGIAATWSGLKTLLLGLAEEIGGGMATFLTLPLRAFLELADRITGKLAGIGLFGFHPFAGPHKAISAVLDGLKQGTTDLFTKGVQNVEKGTQDIVSGFSKAWSKSLKQAAADPTLKPTLKKIGEDIANPIADGASAVIAKVPARATQAMLTALNIAREAAQRAVVAAVVSAEKNLQSIGGRLAQTVNKILDKLGLLGGALAGSPQAVAFKKLRDLIASGAPDFKIQRASQELSSDLVGVGKTALQVHKDAVKAQITQLVSEFNKGQLTAASFSKRVADLLAKNHITYKNVGKILGKAFADGFEENLKALREQAQAIAATPQRFRREANRVTSDGGIFRIVRPLDVMRRENQQIARVAERQRERIAKAAEKTAVATAKTQQQLAGVKVGKVPGVSGHKSANARATARTGVRGS